MAYTFGADDILSALGLSASDFEVQESGSDEQSDTAVVADNQGGFVAASDKQFNNRAEKTITIKPKNPDGVAVSFNMGGSGTSGVVITQFSANQVHNDYATLSVTAHEHLDGNTDNHQSSPAQQAVSLTLGFGVLAVRLGGTLGDCQSAELSGSCEHVDKLNNQGEFLVGASTGFKFEATEEYVDNGSEITPSGAWKEDSQVKATKNNEFYTRTIKAHAYSL